MEKFIDAVVELINGASKRILERLDPIDARLKAVESRTVEPGPMGERGEMGPQGLQGEKGERGASFLSGVGPPPTLGGAPGDVYLDASTGDIYRCG